MTARRDESALDAARRMADFGVGNLVVIDGDGAARPVGIVTDRDLVVCVMASARTPDDVNLEAVMTTEVTTASEDDDIETVLAKLKHSAIRRIPVVDDHGVLQGIISLDDIVDWMAEQMDLVTALIERQRQRITA